MEKLKIKRFAGGGDDYNEPTYSYATNANIKINDDLKLGTSGISLADLAVMKGFFDMFHFETKEFGGATWLKVYYTNSKNGTVLWKDVDELGFSLQTYKWSILGMLPYFYNNTWKYEFLYESVQEGKYNRWRQTSNPLLASQSVSGYSPISIQMSGNNWGGLSLSSTKGTSTIIDGSPGSTDWWYAIGQQTAYQGGIPGGSAAVQEIYLWVRIK